MVSLSEYMIRSNTHIFPFFIGPFVDVIRGGMQILPMPERVVAMEGLARGRVFGVYFHKNWASGKAHFPLLFKRMYWNLCGIGKNAVVWPVSTGIESLTLWSSHKGLKGGGIIKNMRTHATLI